MPDFIGGLAHALFGAVSGAVLALAIRPFKTKQEALRRFLVSCLFGSLTEPVARSMLALDNTVEMRVAIGFLLAVMAWWLLGIVINTLERRQKQDIIDILKDIKKTERE